MNFLVSVLMPQLYVHMYISLKTPVLFFHQHRLHPLNRAVSAHHEYLFHTNMYVYLTIVEVLQRFKYEYLILSRLELANCHYDLNRRQDSNG